MENAYFCYDDCSKEKKQILTINKGKKKIIVAKGKNASRSAIVLIRLKHNVVLKK